ncbi:hypothetical protein ACFOHS_20465 [Jhaorihella thermophila]
MTNPQRHPLPEQPAMPSQTDRAVMADAAAALAVVIRLFDRELDGEALAALRSGDAFAFLDQILETDAARGALGELEVAVSDLPPGPEDPFFSTGWRRIMPTSSSPTGTGLRRRPRSG